ncbi:staygreen family protein [Geobacillus sp. PK12]|uniref:staygreen family protein n=1 Tax=Geobacillus sp. PK12 TaxID=2508525 RepID=UPI001012A56A|nr:staygreen family protein [Geobacillus sp. PK12]RXS87991.1 hypothetical protein ETR37_09600 [Geobacillus sp. PK12]
MKHLSIDRLHTQFAAGTTHTFPLIGRMYTLTHSDATGDLYLAIGRSFATTRLNAMRDEVLGEWKQAGQHLASFIYVFVGSKQMGKEENIRRKQVFEQELTLALEAIRYGDRHFFRHFPSCDGSPILVHFTSEYPELNRTETYGIPYMYR